MVDQETNHSIFRTDWMPAIIYGVNNIFLGLTLFFLPVYFREQLGFSGTQIGIVFTLQAITGVLASFPAGLGNDRITSRLLAFIGITFSAIGLALMGIVNTFIPLLIAYFIFTLNNSIWRMSLDVQVLKTDAGQRTGRRIGLYQAWRFGGSTVGIIIAGYLVNKLDFRTAFLVTAGIGLLMSLFSLGLIPTKVNKIRLSDYYADFSNPRVVLFAGWLFLFSLHWGVEHTCYGLFLRNDFGLSLIGMGWYMSAEFIAVVFTVLIGGRFTEGKNRILQYAFYGLLASGIGHIGMTFPPPELSVIFRALHGVGDGLIFLVFYVGIARLFNVQRLGGNTGLIYLTTMLGMIAGSLIAGPTGEHYGYRHPIWISGIMLMSLAIPLLLTKKKSKTS